MVRHSVVAASNRCICGFWRRGSDWVAFSNQPRGAFKADLQIRDAMWREAGGIGSVSEWMRSDTT